MFTKSDIYELALTFLGISEQVVDIDTDPSNNVTILNANYEKSRKVALADMDLDSTATRLKLTSSGTELVDPWKYAYHYPSDCLKIRRIFSGVVVDDRGTHVDRLVRIVNGQKTILVDLKDASLDYITDKATPEMLNASAMEAMALKLAIFAGKVIKSGGIAAIQEDLEVLYARAKELAKGFDNEENFNPESDAKRSEFVQARLFGEASATSRTEAGLNPFRRAISIPRSAL